MENNFSYLWKINTFILCETLFPMRNLFHNFKKYFLVKEKNVVSLPSNFKETEKMEKKKHIYTEKEAYEKLASLCAMSEQCCWDVKRKMMRWEVEEEMRERIVARLVKERFIDEGRYAQAFVRDKFRYNHWGRVRIEQELKMRHIATQQIEKALEEIEEDDNLEALKQIIEKKRPTIKGKNEYEIKGKLIRFALGKGFAMDDVIKVVGSLDEDM